jgi:DNA polymerase-3 subunit alpha
VKGVGTAAAEEIVRAREEKGEPFTSLFEFCETVDLHAVNRSTLEALVKAGAMDDLGEHRAQVFGAVDAALRVGNQAQADRKAGQMGLFGGGPATAADANGNGNGADALPSAEPWPEREVLAYEKETLGFYLTSHPLARHADTVKAFARASTGRLADLPDRSKVVLAGMIRDLRTTYPKSGRFQNKKMALFRLEDLEGTVGAVLFADAYAKHGEHVEEEAIVFLEGTVDQSREDPSVKADRVIPIERAPQELAASVTLKLPTDGVEKALTPLVSVIERNRGQTPLFLDVPAKDGCRAIVRAAASLSVLPGAEFRREVEGLLGEGAVRLNGFGTNGRGGG